MGAWHESEEARQAVGDLAEREFARRVRCHCGGAFDYIGNLKFSVDFTCEHCGQLVDVKNSSPQFTNVTISEVPFNRYSDDTLIVVYGAGVFTGALRRDIHNAIGPFASTHAPGRKFKATRFYKVPNSNFIALERFGFVVSE